MGAVVPPRDPVALRDALLETLAWDASVRERGAARARDLFGSESCLDRYEAVLKGVQA
jgi:glycosyltransferase involved in cell wall biosynthesis